MKKPDTKKLPMLEELKKHVAPDDHQSFLGRLRDEYKAVVAERDNKPEPAAEESIDDLM